MKGLSPQLARSAFLALVLLVSGFVGCSPRPIPDDLRGRVRDTWVAFHNSDGVFAIRGDGSDRRLVAGIEGEGDSVACGLWPAVDRTGETVVCVWATRVPRDRLGLDRLDAESLSIRQIWSGGHRDLYRAVRPVSLPYDTTFAGSGRFPVEQLGGVAISGQGQVAWVETDPLGDRVFIHAADRWKMSRLFGSARPNPWRNLAFDSSRVLVPSADGLVKELNPETGRAKPIAYGVEAAASPSGDLALIAVAADSGQSFSHGGAIHFIDRTNGKNLQYRVLIRNSFGISSLVWSADGTAILFQAHFPHPVAIGYRRRKLFVLDLKSGQHYYVADL